MKVYDIGDIVTATASFFDRDKVSADPGIVTFKVRKPDGTVITTVYPNAPVVKDSVGHYHSDIDTTGGPPGIWTYHWAGTGNAQASDERDIYIRPSEF